MKYKRNKITRAQYDNLIHAINYHTAIVTDMRNERIFRESAETSLKELLLRAYLLGIKFEYKNNYFSHEQEPNCLIHEFDTHLLDELNMLMYMEESPEREKRKKEIRILLHERNNPVRHYFTENFYCFVQQMNSLRDLLDGEFEYNEKES